MGTEWRRQQLQARKVGARTRPITHRRTLWRHLRLWRCEQRFRVPLPQDAGRTEAGPAQPRQASCQRERVIGRWTTHTPSAVPPGNHEPARESPEPLESFVLHVTVTLAG